jgi:hypothetical protein
MPAPDPGGSGPSGSHRWLIAALLPFVGYFLLLVVLDMRRPADWGAVLSVTPSGLLVSDVRPGSIADDAGLRPGDRLVRAEGRPLASRLDWTAFELTLDLDHPIALDVENGGVPRVVAMTLPEESGAFWVRREGLALLISRLVQALTLAAAFLVLWYRPDTAAGRLAAWLLAAVAVFTVAPPYRLATVWSALPLPIALSLWIPYLSAVAVSAILCSFFGVFPVRQVRGPLAWAGLWAPMVVALVWHVRYVLALIAVPSGTHAPTPALQAVLPLTALYVVVSLALLVRGYRQLDSALDRRRTRVVVLGSLSAFMVGLPVVLAYWSDPHLQLTSSLFTSPLVMAGTLWLLLFPLTFTYALLRHRILGLPMIVRQGVQHALARGALLSIVPAIGGLLHRDQPLSAILATRGWIYILALAAVVVARLRRRVWLDAIDRQFFRQRYDGRVLMQAVAADVRRAGSFETAARTVSARVAEALQPAMAGVLLRRDGDDRCHPVAVVPAECDVPDLDEHSRLVGLVRAVGGPIDLAPLEPRGLGERLPHADRDWLFVSGVELLVPIACGPKGSDALLVLGSRRSEEPYGRDDLDLLEAIADSLALVLGATGDNERAGAMSECPQCGRCYGAGEKTCVVDRIALVGGRVPRRLGDRYLIEQRLARGGMGTVYEAVDTHLGRQVAVKVLREELAENPDAVERFEREARLLASLSHPNIVTVHDAGVLLGTPYLVMERLEGRTVRDLLQAHGAVGPGESVLILRAVASALDSAHAQGIVHRDLKAENVFLAQTGSVRVPKVLDFGLARLVAGGQKQFVTRAAELWGTPAYMAPEQIPGAPPVASWDLYAFTVMAYELITGQLPEAESPPTLAIPVRDFFTTALSPEPSRRPPTARRIVDELEDSLAAAEAGAA